MVFCSVKRRAYSSVVSQFSKLNVIKKLPWHESEEKPKYMLPFMIPAMFQREFHGERGYHLSKCPMLSGVRIKYTNRKVLIKVESEYEWFHYIEFSGTEEEIIRGMDYFMEQSQTFSSFLYPMLHFVPRRGHYVSNLEDMKDLKVSICDSQRVFYDNAESPLTPLLIEPRAQRENFVLATKRVIDSVWRPRHEIMVAKRAERESLRKSLDGPTMNSNGSSNISESESETNNLENSESKCEDDNVVVEQYIVRNRSSYGEVKEIDLIRENEKRHNLPDIIDASKVDPLFLVGLREYPWKDQRMVGFELRKHAMNMVFPKARAPWTCIFERKKGRLNVMQKRLAREEKSIMEKYLKTTTTQ